MDNVLRGRRPAENIDGRRLQVLEGLLEFERSGDGARRVESDLVDLQALHTGQDDREPTLSDRPDAQTAHVAARFLLVAAFMRSNWAAFSIIANRI